MTCHHDEQLPLGVMPVLPLGDARAADVDAHLSAVSSVYQLRERATVVHVHLQSVLKFIDGKIGQVQRIQLLGKGTVRHFRHHQSDGLRLELLQQIYDLAQRDLVGHRDSAVAAVCIQNRLYTVKFTVLLLAFQQIKHSFYKIIDIKHFQFCASIIYCKFFIVCYCPTKC